MSKEQQIGLHLRHEISAWLSGGDCHGIGHTSPGQVHLRLRQIDKESPGTLGESYRLFPSQGTRYTGMQGGGHSLSREVGRQAGN